MMISMNLNLKKVPDLFFDSCLTDTHANDRRDDGGPDDSDGNKCSIHTVWFVSFNYTQLELLCIY